jgi:hypothetical protein
MLINISQNIKTSSSIQKVEYNLRKNSYFSVRHKNKQTSINMKIETKDDEEKQKLGPEKIFFEGPPSKVELIIPFFSILTVIGIIPFFTTLLRQFWVNYKITNRRISVKSGFQGNNRSEIVYRDIKKIKYIKRLGGEAADVVFVLKDNAQLELRSLPNWKENLDFIKSNCTSDVECQ